MLRVWHANAEGIELRSGTHDLREVARREARQPARDAEREAAHLRREEDLAERALGELAAVVPQLVYVREQRELAEVRAEEAGDHGRVCGLETQPDRRAVWFVGCQDERPFPPRASGVLVEGGPDREAHSREWPPQGQERR